VAFQFRLETLLKHRRALQDIAQKDYAEAEAKVRAKLDYIKSLYAEIDQARKERSRAEAKLAFTANSLSGVEEFIALTYIKIERARKEARELMQIMEQKHAILIEKAKERKIIEKIKERKMFEYKAELKKLEAKEMDDMTSMRYRFSKGAL
jgi:flagellar FliJ protein